MELYGLYIILLYDLDSVAEISYRPARGGEDIKHVCRWAAMTKHASDGSALSDMVMTLGYHLWYFSQHAVDRF